MSETRIDESSYKQMLENNWDAVVFANLEGWVQYANPAAHKMYGYDPDELVGKHVDIFNAHQNRDTDDIIQAIIDKGGWSGDIIQKRKDGTHINALLTVSLIFGPEGQPIGYASNSKDVGERVTARAAIEQRQRELQVIIDTTDNIICLLDRNLDIRYANKVLTDRVALDGIDLRPGDPIFKGVPEPFHERLRERYARVLNGEQFKITDDYVTRDGEDMSLESNYFPVFVDGEVLSIVLYTRNITEEVRKKKILEDALSEKEALLAEIHHRLKNNLAVISSMLHVEAMSSESDEVQSVLEECQARIKTTALVHEMLYENESLTTIDLNDYLGKLVPMIEDSYSSGGKDIHVKFHANQVKMRLDTAIPCALIINELLTNSFKYAFEGRDAGMVDIDITLEGGNYVLTVQDDGQGLGDNHDISSATSTGFVLLRAFADQLEGDLSYQYERGARFTLKFPSFDA